MIFSMFEKQREINAIIDDLRRQGNLDEANARKTIKRLFFALALFSPFLFLSILFFIVLFLSCSQDQLVYCYEGSARVRYGFLLLLAILFIFIFYKNAKSIFIDQIFLIKLMTYGKRVQGKFIEGAVCGPTPGTHYRCEYSFYDDDQKLITGTASLGKYPKKKDRKKGDKIIVAYDPENPEKNVCILDGALDHYDLKLKREK